MTTQKMEYFVSVVAEVQDHGEMFLIEHRRINILFGWSPKTSLWSCNIQALIRELINDETSFSVAAEYQWKSLCPLVYQSGRNLGCKSPCINTALF
jgi:hypothetical protein